MLRALCCVVLIACHDPAPPKPVAPAPRPAAPVASGPSWLGVRLDPDARITQIVHGAPGERAGLHIGDQIVTLDGRRVTPNEFVDRVMGTPVGRPVEIVIVRGGGRITFRIPVEARPVSPARSALLDKPAPAFEAAQLAGPYSTTLADHRGHVVIVDFWATWCGPCAFSIPRLKALHDRYATRGLRIIGLSDEDPATIQKFVDSAQINYAIGRDRDDEISLKYLREGIPMFVIIDKQGVVRQVIVGADMDAVDEAVPPLL